MKLTELKRKFGTRSEAAIRSEIESLRTKRRQFEREHRRLREDAHQQLDQRVADAEAHVELTIQAHGPDVLSIPLIGTSIANPSAQSLVDLHAMYRFARDEVFIARLHAAIDSAPDGIYSTLSRADYEAKLAGFDTHVAELEVELRRRVVEQQEIAAKQARQELEGSVTG